MFKTPAGGKLSDTNQYNGNINITIHCIGESLSNNHYKRTTRGFEHCSSVSWFCGFSRSWRWLYVFSLKGARGLERHRQVTHLHLRKLSQSFWGFRWFPRRISRHRYPSSLFRSPISLIHAGSWMVPPRQLARLGPRCLGYFHTRKAREASKTSSLNWVWTGFELGFRQVGDSWCHFFWHVYTYWFFSELVSNVFSNLLKLTLKPRGTPCVLQQQSLEAWGDLEATNQNQVEQPLVKNISRYTLAMLWWITKYLSFLLSQDFGSCFTRSSRNIHEALK